MASNVNDRLVRLVQKYREEEAEGPYVPPPHNPPVTPEELFNEVVKRCTTRVPCTTLNFPWRRYEGEEEHADWDRDKLVVDQVTEMLRAEGLAVHTPHKRWVPSEMVPYIGGDQATQAHGYHALNVAWGGGKAMVEFDNAHARKG